MSGDENLKEPAIGGSVLNGGLEREANQNADLMPCGTAVTNFYDAYAAGVKAEREACAKACGTLDMDSFGVYPIRAQMISNACANVIRARSNKTN